jgi:hypothetical protein
MAAVDPRCRRAGFDIRGTPFGQLRDSISIYCRGYTNFTLAQFCDGYIFEKPLSEYEGVTPIPDFVNEKNLEQARAQSPNPRLRQAPMEMFNRGVADDADIPRRFKSLRPAGTETAPKKQEGPVP